MHPIFALWSHPRSMSTAMERVMRERGDLDCAHEPFMYDYYVHRQVRQFPMFDMQEDQPQSYTEIRDMLMRRAETGPVFFKDMSFYVYEQVLEDAEFSARLTNSFLIRNPVASILSYFKLDPDATMEEIGLEAQFRHYNALVTRGEAPVILEADDVRGDTRGMMTAWWQIIGLPFRERAFDWQTPAPEDWDHVEGWHGDVSNASGIRPLSAADVAKQRADFEAMAKTHPRMLDCLEHHLPFYEALKAQALNAAGKA
ncbi:hypothetical protein EI983_02360 [Roseovarius faecimaris]|uniref:Sulfotransferase family protein n=1 Tax=Roseovarius faecimaris TaxID=2494550 RepID=A0A6I6IN06_9RHOB|nr:hypothetical protein [Roseovarius faecimaris]QGX97183.1 hypothetical protein EI983_02360 [Roseovarius faecimaris]